MSVRSQPDPRTTVEACSFYRQVLGIVTESEIPFQVGGAYAFEYCTGIARFKKDLDFIVRPDDCERVLRLLAAVGYDTELTFSHWLGKVFQGDCFIDVIFSSGNGVALVDDEWMAHGINAEILGMPVNLSPPEEMIWSKAFVMERERYDGADIAHLIFHRGKCLDWQRLLRRFGPHWPVLLSHLVLFDFVYPTQRSCIPAWVRDELQRRQQPPSVAPRDANVCQGTLLSREQYRFDIERLGYLDARLPPYGGMTREQIARWTAACSELEASSGGATASRGDANLLGPVRG